MNFVIERSTFCYYTTIALFLRYFAALPRATLLVVDICYSCIRHKDTFLSPSLFHLLPPLFSFLPLLLTYFLLQYLYVAAKDIYDKNKNKKV